MRAEDTNPKELQWYITMFYSARSGLNSLSGDAFPAYTQHGIATYS